MGKIIEVAHTIADLMDDNIRIADREQIISINGTSDLTATFDRDQLRALINLPGSNGFRLYPAAHNDELIMVAYAANGLDDMITEDHFCIACNGDGPVNVNGAPVVDNVQLIPPTLARDLIRGQGSGQETVNQLNNIRQTDQSEHGLKVLFDNELLENEEFDRVSFEIVDVVFQGGNAPVRTIIGSVIQDELPVLEGLSMLPCPPNCGGVYGAHIA